MRLFFLLLSVVSITSFAQLSDKWEGKFIGTLIATNLEDKTADYHMEMHVKLKADYTYDWTIVYGDDSTKQERAYILKPDGQNHFILDEQNGVELHMSHSSNSLTSVFEVQGNLLHVTYTLTKKGIQYQLTSSNSKKFSGGEKDESGKDIPEVGSYKTVAYQSSFLKRSKN
ncbi:MAG: hypothetical protein ACI857_002635 [Arenicella sp.]|jgi:hypothetical protein